jgi:hypothetical protein
MADYDGLDDNDFSEQEDAADFYPDEENDDGNDEAIGAMMGGDRSDIGDEMQAAGDNPDEDEGDEDEEEQVRIARCMWSFWTVS